MSLRNEIAKIYVRLVFRENEEDFDSLKTQKKLSLPEPPKNIAQRCEPLETGAGHVDFAAHLETHGWYAL